MNKAIATYRIAFTADEINDLILDIQTASVRQHLSPCTKSALTKLQKKAFEDKIGAATPAYIQTGRVNKPTLSLDSLTQMNPAIPKDKIVVTDNYVGIERRNIGDTKPNWTPEQIEDAKFECANHFVTTGEKKDWHEFIKQPTITPEEERRVDNLNTNSDMSDDALFKSLGG